MMTEVPSSRPLFQRSWFELLGLPERFRIDQSELEARHRRFQSAVHPDRHVAGAEHDRRLALQLAAQGNEALRVLSDPCGRAAYLCERHGAAVDAERNTAMPPAFLMEQMSWREEIDDVRDAGSAAAADALQSRLDQARGDIIERLAQLIDEEGDYQAAAIQVRQLMFFERLRTTLAEVIRQISAAG